MHDGDVHQPLGAGVGFGGGGPEANLDGGGAGDQRAEEIEHAGEAHYGGEQADGYERRGVENNLAEGAGAVLVDYRKHQNAGAGVIFAVHPGDGVEMRELPEKKNGEEQPGAGASSLPVAAAQPIIGGMAPGMAPMKVAQMVRFFSGV